MNFQSKIIQSWTILIYNYIYWDLQLDIEHLLDLNNFNFK